MRENVRHWLEEYRFDGLRFDATHALVDRSPTHIVHELTRSRPRGWWRPVESIVSAENEPQDTSSRAPGRYGLRRGQPVERRLAPCGVRGADRTTRGVLHRLSGHARRSSRRWRDRNLLYQGQWYSWQKQPRGQRCDASIRTPRSSAFSRTTIRSPTPAPAAVCISSSIVRKWRALSTLLLLGPAVPLLFQGQEEAVEQPFTYFADHQPPLVRRGAQRAARVSVPVSLAIVSGGQGAASGSHRTKTRSRHVASTGAGRRAEQEARRLYTDLIALRHTDPVLSRLGTRT